MNRVMLAGNIATSVDVKKFDGGGKKASFSIAINEKYYNKKKEEWEKRTDFIWIVAWDNNAEQISKHFDKGDGIILECRMRSRKFEGDDGKSKTLVDVVVDKFYFPPGKKQKDSSDEYDKSSSKKTSKSDESEDLDIDNKKSNNDDDDDLDLNLDDLD